MDKTSILEKVSNIASKRGFLVQLLEKPDLGSLRLDVNQAIDELDELLDEVKQTFPEDSIDR